jgi:hypothetical protein
LNLCIVNFEVLKLQRVLLSAGVVQSLFEDELERREAPRASRASRVKSVKSLNGSRWLSNLKDLFT